MHLPGIRKRIKAITTRADAQADGACRWHAQSALAIVRVLRNAKTISDVTLANAGRGPACGCRYVLDPVGGGRNAIIRSENGSGEHVCHFSHAICHIGPLRPSPPHSKNITSGDGARSVKRIEPLVRCEVSLNRAVPTRREQLRLATRTVNHHALYSAILSSMRNPSSPQEENQ